MKADDHRAQDSSRTRSLILDATEALMREEGYAAVSSRRVAERAGLKSPLVHYHFGTMDELFLELFRRAENAFFAKHLKALTSAAPAEELWKFSTDAEGVDLVVEFVAAANHRKALRDELARATERMRTIQNAILARSFADLAAPGGYSPEVVSFLIASVSRALTSEKSLGVTAGHAEIIAFMESLLGISNRR